MCCCIYCATLQFMNADPNLYKQYSGGHLILPCGAQCNKWIFPMILEPCNHCKLLKDSTGKPYLMETVGDFWVSDPIFKGSYGDSLLYTPKELCDLRDQGIYIPVYHIEVPPLPAPLYHQAWEPESTALLHLKVTASDMPMESGHIIHSSRKDSTQHSSGHSSTTSTPKRPNSTMTSKTSSSREVSLGVIDPLGPMVHGSIAIPTHPPGLAVASSRILMWM